MPKSSSDAVASPSPAVVPRVLTASDVPKMLSAQANCRLMRAFRSLQDPAVAAWCRVSLHKDQVNRWNVCMYYNDGPMHDALTHYKLPCLTLDIIFPAGYPGQAPEVRVVSPTLAYVAGGQGAVFGGALCLEFLHKWDASTDEKALLTTLHFALSDANVQSRRSGSRWGYKLGIWEIRSAHSEWRPTPDAPQGAGRAC